MLPAPDTLFTPVTSKRSFEEVADRIKALIIDGRLKPGDRLPSEVELAAQFGVSRQTLREALRILEISGLVAVQRGGAGGPVVRNTLGQRISDLLMDALRLERVTLEELTVARLGIERLVLSLACAAAGEDDFQRLEDNMARARARLDSGQRATAENLEFHRILARASGNNVLVVVIESIFVLLEELLGRLGPDLAVSAGALGDHERIVAALRGRRAAEADRLMEEHLFEVRTRLLG
ncbi:MAG: FadR/GntR family transcriptional regulator [Deferrisomatales bacterium]